MMRAVGAVFSRDLQLAQSRAGDTALPLAFFVMVGLLFPLAMDPDAEHLRAIGPGVVWVAALLASLMPLTALYRDDLEDGSLEQLLLCPAPLPMICLARSLAQWLVTGLPLVIVAPVLGVGYGLSQEATVVMMVGLLLGTPTLSLLGSVGAALTAGVRRSSGLMALLILPLEVPILIFGGRAAALAQEGSPADGPLLMLAALLLLALSLTPWASAAALRIHGE